MVRNRFPMPPSRSRSRDSRGRAVANIFFPRTSAIPSPSRPLATSSDPRSENREPVSLPPSRSREARASDYSGLRNFVARGISSGILASRMRRVGPRGSRTSRGTFPGPPRSSTVDDTASATCSERKYVPLATCHGACRTMCSGHASSPGDSRPRGRPPDRGSDKVSSVAEAKILDVALEIAIQTGRIWSGESSGRLDRAIPGAECHERAKIPSLRAEIFYRCPLFLSLHPTTCHDAASCRDNVLWSFPPSRLRVPGSMTLIENQRAG